MTQASATPQSKQQTTDKNAIRPFHVNVPEAELTELRRRINATKWPERETVADASQRQVQFSSCTRSHDRRCNAQPTRSCDVYRTRYELMYL